LRAKRRSRRTDNEVELSVLGLLIVFGFVITLFILEPVRCSLAAIPCGGVYYRRIVKHSSEETVKAPSTKRGKPAELMLCTRISVPYKALISSDFIRIVAKREYYSCRFNLEQLKVFVKHWAAKLIRTEEEPKHAGEP
jgi:hypothetical protein